MLSCRFFNENMSAFAPCANAAFSCAYSAFAYTLIVILDAILASIFVIGLGIILGLSALLAILLVLAVLVLVGLVIPRCHAPWC